MAFKTIMVTNLAIKANDDDHRSKIVLDVKYEVCDRIGAPPPGQGSNVTLTHKNMGKLARMMEDFEKEYFPKFDRNFTKWLRRHREKGATGTDYDSCFHRFGCCGQSRVRNLSGFHTDVRSPLRIGCRLFLRILVGLLMLFRNQALEKKQEIEKEQAEARGHPEMEDILPMPRTTSSGKYRPRRWEC